MTINAQKRKKEDHPLWCLTRSLLKNPSRSPTVQQLLFWGIVCSVFIMSALRACWETEPSLCFVLPPVFFHRGTWHWAPGDQHKGDHHLLVHRLRGSWGTLILLPTTKKCHPDASYGGAEWKPHKKAKWWPPWQLLSWRRPFACMQTGLTAGTREHWEQLQCCTWKLG